MVSTTPRPLYPRERPGTHCSNVNKRHANNLHLDVLSALRNAVCSHQHRDEEAVTIASQERLRRADQTNRKKKFLEGKNKKTNIRDATNVTLSN